MRLVTGCRSHSQRVRVRACFVCQDARLCACVRSGARSQRCNTRRHASHVFSRRRWCFGEAPLKDVENIRKGTRAALRLQHQAAFGKPQGQIVAMCGNQSLTFNTQDAYEYRMRSFLNQVCMLVCWRVRVVCWYVAHVSCWYVVTCWYVGVCVCLEVCMHACIRACRYMGVYLCMHLYVFVGTHACMYQ